MTTKTPPQEPVVAAAIEAACQKCGSRAKSVEYDRIGMVITCAICGKCAYLDRNNQPIEERQELEETKTGIQESNGPVEVAPDAAEIRRGDNLEYQERQPPERDWEPAISEAEESAPEALTNEAEDSKREAVTNEVEESRPETMTNEAEESAPEPATNNEAEESEPEAMTNDAEESAPEAAANEVGEPTPEAATNEVGEPESEARTSEAKESAPEAVTNEVEESAPEAVTNEAEESEPEAVTNEAEESEPEAVTNEVGEPTPEAVTNEAEESAPEAATNEAEESTPEAATSEAEESTPEAATSEAEEPEQLAISMAGKSEMQNDGCPNCGKPKDPKDIRRYQRTALRQCTTCLMWEINPGQERKPGSQTLAISIALQMNFQGAGSREIQEKIDLLTENVRMGRNSLHYWARRYAKPAIERARKLQVVNSSGEWELDIVSLKYRTQQHHCWSITDSRTQYILATERTSQSRIGEELFKMAMHAAGEEPHTILFSADMKKYTQGLAEQARTATLIQRSPSEENSNGSMARLRNAVTKRMESARGGFNQGTMEYILGALAMSINLFEQSEQLGDQTPAEAAGVETPYQNWEDMVKKEEATDNPAASGDSGSETMLEGLDATEPVETMPEEESKTIMQELEKILKELDRRHESLVREHQQVVRDRGAVKRTMEILNREQPAVNGASPETIPVA